MNAKLNKLRKVRKSTAMACASIAFLITPAGFGLSLVVGAAAAIASAAYDVYSHNTKEELSMDDLFEDEIFNEIAEHAVLVAGCGIIMATPIGLGALGIAIKLGLFVAWRRLWHMVITKSNRTPYFNSQWAFKFRIDDCLCTFKF